MFGRKLTWQNVAPRLLQGRKGLDMVEILLGLALLGAIVAVVYRLLGSAILDFGRRIISTLFSWG
jgi:hypothetical protein